MKIKSILLSMGLVAFTAISNAAVINGNSELQGVVDSAILSQSSGIVDVQNDQVLNDEVWAVFQPSSSTSSFIATFWGGNTNTTDPSANTAVFGIYDIYDFSKTVDLSFSSFNNNVTFSIRASDGRVGVNNLDSGINFTANRFGFYNTNTFQGTTYTGYSQMSRNAGGKDAMLTYNHKNGFLNPGQKLLAFDPNLSGDFDDLVVTIESAAPVPAPGVLALMGLGLAGIGLSRRKTKK